MYYPSGLQTEFHGALGFLQASPGVPQVTIKQSGENKYKKSPGRLHTWKNDQKAGEGAHRDGAPLPQLSECSCRVRNQQKCCFGRLKRFQTTGKSVTKVGGGRPRTTTAGDDRYIILQAKRGRRQSASVIAQQRSTATRRQVSRFTVARRLHKGGLFARRRKASLRWSWSSCLGRHYAERAD
ncbi:transposable element Tcb2 transposase [Trichonephila clavipes]|nr:transposable element Tcb2 transposase [Trichonephila clavipes]